MTLTDDLVGTIRRSRLTGSVLIRTEQGWICVAQRLTDNPLHWRWAHHYTDIGGWNTDLDNWELMEVVEV